VRSDIKVREYMESMGYNFCAKENRFELHASPFRLETFRTCAIDGKSSSNCSVIDTSKAKQFYLHERQSVLQAEINGWRRGCTKEEWALMRETKLLSQVEIDNVDELEQQLKELEDK